MISPLSLYAAEVEHAERLRRAEDGRRLAELMVELAASAPAGARRARLAGPIAWMGRLVDRIGRFSAAHARASGRIGPFGRGGLRTCAQVAQEEPPVA
jgi:hypothetical protein